MCLFCTVQLSAQEIRVSIKIILDATGNRPGQILTNEKFDSAFHWINERMVEYNRGIEFVPFEYVEIGGPTSALTQSISNTYNGPNVIIDPNGNLITSLENSAQSFPSAFAWRSDMINVYYSLTQNSNGICSFPTTAGHDEGILIDHRRADEPEVLLHEIGHFFDLKHTADESCGTTASDDNSWDRNTIALQNFGLPYSLLSSANQMLVDDTFNNVMSQIRNQGESRVVLTECQLDKWHQTLVNFTTRTDVTSGSAFYVDDNDPNPCNILPGGSPCGCNGKPDVPFENAHCSFDQLDGVTKDVIVFKPGMYEADQHSNVGIVLDKPALLTATRQGNAVIKP